jgi:hypothetical protein
MCRCLSGSSTCCFSALHTSYNCKWLVNFWTDIIAGIVHFLAAVIAAVVHFLAATTIFLMADSSLGRTLWGPWDNYLPQPGHCTFGDRGSNYLPQPGHCLIRRLWGPWDNYFPHPGLLNLALIIILLNTINK